MLLLLRYCGCEWSNFRYPISAQVHKLEGIPWFHYLCVVYFVVAAVIAVVVVVHGVSFILVTLLKLLEMLMLLLLLLLN